MAPLDQNRGQPFWLRLPTVIAVVVMLALGKTWLAAKTGLSFDESYYTLWSLHLSPGYLDHPPVVAFLIALGRLIGGDDELGVRLPAIFCVIITSAAMYRIGVLLLDRNAAALAVIWYNLTLPGALGLIITPDSPSVASWALTIWALAEFMRSKNPNWWFVVGIAAGLGLASKYTNAFLPPGLLLLALTTAERRKWLGLWQLWAGVGLMLVVFSPVLWWNARHDWISFGFQGQRTIANGIDPNFLGNLSELLLGQALFMLPVLAIFAIVGLAKFLLRPSDPARAGVAPLVWTSLPLIAYFLFHTLHARVEANWLGPVWPMLSLVAAWAILDFKSERWFVRWPVNSAIALQILLGVTMIGIIYAQMLRQPFDNPNIDRTRETRGWRQLQQAMNAIAQSHGARWIATAGDYGVTGEFSTYGFFARDPLQVRQIDQSLRYDYLPPIEAEALQWPALLVLQGGPDDDFARAGLFGSIEPVGTVTRHSATETMESYTGYLVSDPTAKFFATVAAKTD